jgi:autotransporter-associated beta strand protein
VSPSLVTVSNSVNYTFGGPGAIAGNTALVKTGFGSLTLTNQHTYTGGTTINQGSLVLGSAGGLADSPLISVASGATFDVSAVSGGFQLQNGQTLSGCGQVNGAVTVSSGTVLSPGGSTGGTLTFNAPLKLRGTTLIQLSRSSSSVACGSVSDTNNVSCGGLLVLTNQGANSLQAGDSLKIFNAPVSGLFANIVPINPGPGLLWARYNVDGRDKSDLQLFNEH